MSNYKKIYGGYEYHIEKIDVQYNIFNQNLEKYKPPISRYYIIKYCRKNFMLNFSKNKKLLEYFVILPLLYVLIFGLGFLINPTIDQKGIILNIFSIYITISTIFLSVAVIILSIFFPIQKRSSYSIKLRKNGVGKILFWFFFYSIASLGSTLIAYVVMNLSSPSAELIPFFEIIFLLVSFFVVGTIFGVTHLSKKILMILLPNF